MLAGMFLTLVFQMSLSPRGLLSIVNPAGSAILFVVVNAVAAASVTESGAGGIGGGPGQGRVGGGGGRGGGGGFIFSLSSFTAFMVVAITAGIALEAARGRSFYFASHGNFFLVLDSPAPPEVASTWTLRW